MPWLLSRDMPGASSRRRTPLCRAIPGAGHEVGPWVELVQQSERDLIIQQVFGFCIERPAVGHDDVRIDKLVDIDTGTKARCGSRRFAIVPLVGIDLNDVDRQNRRSLDPRSENVGYWRNNPNLHAFDMTVSVEMKSQIAERFGMDGFAGSGR